MEGKSSRLRIFLSCLKEGLIRFVVVALFITLVVLCSVMAALNVNQGSSTWSHVNFPWRYKPSYPPMDPKYNNYTVLLDGHSQTIYSDGSLTPEQNIQWHIANGYNAMVVSDHNTLKGGLATQKIAREKYSDSMKVLVAQEYSCCRLHMNLIGISQMIPAVAFPTDEQIQQVINETHKQGGIVVINHIPWSINGPFEDTHPSLQQLKDWGVDYLEVVNQNTFDYQGYRFAMDNNMGLITGTDLHSPKRGVNGWTTLIPKNYSEEAIFDCLKNKDTSFIFSAIDSPYSPNPREIPPKTLIWQPFYYLGNAILEYYSWKRGIYSFTHVDGKAVFCTKGTHWKLDWRGVGFLLGWAIFAFLFFEIFRQFFEKYLIPKLSKKCKRNRRNNNYNSNNSDRDSFSDMDAKVSLLSDFTSRSEREVW